MNPQRVKDPDLTAFRAVAGQKVRWEDRLKLIQRQFPSTLMDEDGWRRAFDRDIDLLGFMLRDILKADQAVPGRPGPRPSLNVARAEPVLDSWMGRDPTSHPYTLLKFFEAFRLLTRGRSITQISRKVSLPRTQVFRLLSNLRDPTRAEMEQIAEAYGKQPSYFLEFRVGMIAAGLMDGLYGTPQHTIRLYEAMHKP